MTDWIIKLTGSAVESGSTVVGFDLGTAGGVGAGIIVLIAAVLVAVVIVSYRWMPEEQTSFRKGLLIILRLAFLSLLLGILFQPVLTLNLERKIRQTLLVMLDASRSMPIADPRVTGEDLKRAAIA